MKFLIKYRVLKKKYVFRKIVKKIKLNNFIINIFNNVFYHNVMRIKNIFNNNKNSINYR